jgi:hypothetical protein
MSDHSANRKTRRRAKPRRKSWRPIGGISSAVICLWLGSLCYEASPDLMHVFAFSCDTTTRSIRCLEPLRRRAHLKWLSGVGLCKIPYARFPEYPFHALRCIRARRRGGPVEPPPDLVTASPDAGVGAPSLASYSTSSVKGPEGPVFGLQSSPGLPNTPLNPCLTSCP